jgi:hypothetical protein
MQVGVERAVVVAVLLEVESVVALKETQAASLAQQFPNFRPNCGLPRQSG